VVAFRLQKRQNKFAPYDDSQIKPTEEKFHGVQDSAVVRRRFFFYDFVFGAGRRS
jgi:hypothetical protein